MTRENLQYIGTPRAFGQALGKQNLRAAHCYSYFPSGSLDAANCVAGHYEGAETAFKGIVPPETQQTPPSGQEGA